jgi:DNA-binding MarR family transcriptional regulator
VSSPAHEGLERRELLEKLIELGRAMSTQTVFLHQAIAQTVGLNATDTKCIDLILRAPEGQLTAGQLAALSGLSSGAITHILDRLEKRDFVARRRDDADRRKVYVRARRESLAPLVPRYEAIGKAYLDLLAQYRDEELRLICDYLQKTSTLSGCLLDAARQGGC